MNALKSCWCFTLFAALLLVVGCGKSCDVKLAGVHGKVTLNGEPVKGLRIMFQPASGRPSIGITDSNGEYDAHYNRTQDGVVVGEVTIFFEGFDDKVEEVHDDGTITLPVESSQYDIPEKYFETFRTESISSGTNTIDIEIQ
ncbi:transthyretin-like family protein [Calycomorphotria hydatis]|uniref:Nickel uptake substrate-specific transmembrane region n=1 Tax=Calycomorphotria hydatis TaxID=2528027 RepID=A0A517TA16_9PLAN|nr:hypothetical protein [Calycomorphotria hydatis]QDT65222.1 hypothetical protein V22_24690 [Calycomorphotria hydatis]